MTPFPELRRAAMARRRLLDNLERIEELTSTTAARGIALSMAATTAADKTRRMVRSAPLASLTAAVMAGMFLAPRRSMTRFPGAAPLATTPAGLTPHPVLAGLASLGLQLVVDGLTAWAAGDRFKPHD